MATLHLKLLLPASIMFAIMSIFSCTDDLETIEWTGGPRLSGTCEWQKEGGDPSTFTDKMVLLNEGDSVTASGFLIEGCEEGQGTILDSAFVVPKWNATSMLITKQVHATCGETPLSIDCQSIKIKNPAGQVGADFWDVRDWQIYQTVVIDSVTWMAENLNYDGNSGNLGKCLDNPTNFCNVYGRLYSFDEAKEACPGGWHLPSADEWNGLLLDNDYNRLIAKTGWSFNCDDCNATAFTALPQGIGVSKAYWYSSSGTVYGLALVESIFTKEISENPTDLHSVRCVKD